MLEAASYTALETLRNNCTRNTERRCIVGNGTTSNSCLKPQLLMVDIRAIGWWYWLMTAALLTANGYGWIMDHGRHCDDERARHH